MRALRGGGVAGLLALVVVPASAQAAEFARRRRQGRRHAAHRLLPRRLDSRPFRLAASDALQARTEGSSGGTGAVRLLYPKAVKDRDITSRPPAPDGGAARVRVGSRTIRIAQRHGSVFRFPTPAGAPVSLEAARDRHDNYVGGP